MSCFEQLVINRDSHQKGLKVLQYLCYFANSEYLNAARMKRPHSSVYQFCLVLILIGARSVSVDGLAVPIPTGQWFTAVKENNNLFN